MKRSLVLVVALTLFATNIVAEEPKANDFKTYIAELPPCNRVEVIRLGSNAAGVVDGKWVVPEDKSNIYHVEPYDEWWTILARKDVMGPDVERIASNLRAFQPRISEHISADGTRTVSKGANCHVPPFAYRFFAGERLLYDTSVCWGCENLIVGPDGKRHYFYFNTKTKGAISLLKASEKLFPEFPVK